jgi:hypothetical protein
MAERLFLFLQFEFPWELGPPDGRYLLRGRADAEPERVVVLDTVGAARRRGRLGTRRPQTTPEPSPVPTARATVIDPVSVSAEGQAHKWLTQLDATRETQAAAGTLNRVLFAHRIATADPYVHEISPAQALIVRAGWGEGEQVAYGQWLHARELTLKEGRARRLAVLRSEERFAALLGARTQPLACEELALRARLDLDEGRLAYAALELERAYAAAVTELSDESMAVLDERVEELRQLHPGVVDAARSALPAAADASAAHASEPAARDPGEPDEEALRHALGRLEAALRARTAAGLGTD